VNRRLGALLVFLTGVALYGPTLRYAFTYDDVPIIAKQPLLHSLAHWREILALPWWKYDLYRPLTSLTLAADWSLSGGNPALFHLNNALLHGVASVLVFLLALGLVPYGAALVAGLLFAVHPVHVEAVANVVGRAEVLATVLTLLAALAYRADGELAARGDTRSGARWLASFGTLVAVLCGLASKETAFATPGVLLLVDWLSARRADEPLSKYLGRHWVLWAGVVGLTLEWLWIRSMVVGNLVGAHPAPGLEGLGLPGRTLVMLPVVIQFLRLLFLPGRLSADYSPNFLPITDRITAGVVAGAVLLAACVGVALAARHRAPAVTFALAWIGGTLLIVSNLILPSGILLAERTLYLASVGACILLAVLWEALRRRAGAAAVGAIAVLIAAGAIRSLMRSEIWRSNGTLFPQLVRDAPGSFRADWVAGMLAYGAGDRRTGERLLRKGLHRYPRLSVMWEDLATELQRERRWTEAADAFWNAFRVDPNTVASAAMAVGAGIQAGGIDSAESRLRVALGKHPDDDDLRIAASHVALARGNPLRAMTLRREVARRSPEDPVYWYLTAEAARQAKFCPELIRSLDRLRALEPDAPGLTALTDSSVTLGCAAPKGAVVAQP
jgi:tetratricopeptide (TPR) repeat protein